MHEEKIKNQILTSIAPCSMFCQTCTGCKYGSISHHAKKLIHLLKGHEEFLKHNLKPEYQHKLKEFHIFHKKLKKYAEPKCGGCRENRHPNCCIKNCIIPECAKKHNVFFCADCPEFPCNNINEDTYKTTTIKKWKTGNEEIQKIGIENYYEKYKDISHYISYSKNIKN